MNEVRCEARIVEATVYPRQARLKRRAETVLEAGENLVVIGPLPAALTRDSLRVQASPGFLIRDLVVEDRYLPAADPESAHAALQAERDSLADGLALAASRIRTLDDEFRLFAERSSILELLERERSQLISVQYWKEFLAFLRDRLTANRAAARKELFGWLEGRERLQAVQSRLDAIASQGQRTEHVASITVEAAVAGPCVLELSCLQDGASWHPAYGIRVNPEASTVDIAFYAMVRQETGEDWPGVGLLFSTAMPRGDCRLPELRSRRLREASRTAILREEEVSSDALVSAPAENDKVDAFFAADEAEPMAPSPAMEKAKKAMPPPAGRTVSVQRRAAMPSAMAASLGGVMGAPAAPPPSPQPYPAPKPAADRPRPPFDPWAAISKAEAALSRLPDEASLPGFFADFVALLSPPAAPSLSAGALDSVNAFFQEGTDPEHSSGGFDYRYPAARERNDLPSVAAAVQIPVKTLSLPVELVRVTVPVESEQAFLKAVFVNRGQPLLQGPAQVFLGNDFVSGIDLPTLGSEQEGSLSLGVDRDIKVVRKEDSKAREKGLAFKDLITDFTVGIELASFKDEPVRIEVYDRVPVARNPKEAEVIDLGFSRPPDKRSDRGIVCWRETLEPGQKKVIEIRYSVRLKEDYRMVLTRDARPHDGSWTEVSA